MYLMDIEIGDDVCVRLCSFSCAWNIRLFIDSMMSISLLSFSRYLSLNSISPIRIPSESEWVIKSIEWNAISNGISLFEFLTFAHANHHRQCCYAPAIELSRCCFFLVLFLSIQSFSNQSNKSQKTIVLVSHIKLTLCLYLLAGMHKYVHTLPGQQQCSNICIVWKRRYERLISFESVVNGRRLAISITYSFIKSNWDDSLSVHIKYTGLSNNPIELFSSNRLSISSKSIKFQQTFSSFHNF